jgi:serine/threonine-protein kinase
MGAVYLVEHVHMRKRLALKVLREAVSANPEVVARFEREAMAAAHIEHPNVATATDFGRTEAGAFFLVIEYVQGESLRAIVSRGPLSVARVVDIAVQMTAALAKAHSLGIVHRDLKPENVMIVSREGEPELVKILDFGVAKVPVEDLGSKSEAAEARAGQPLTRMGAVMGTPDYMAPEQALGEGVDARADLYSLGVMLYEMLLGVRPFDVDDPVVLLGKVVTEEPPPMKTRAPAIEIPAELEAIVMKLLARDPNARYASAADASQAIVAFALAQGLLRQSSPAFSPFGDREARPVAVGSARTMLAAADDMPPSQRKITVGGVSYGGKKNAPALVTEGLARAKSAARDALAWLKPRVERLAARARPLYARAKNGLPPKARPAAPLLLAGFALVWVAIPIVLISLAFRGSGSTPGAVASGAASESVPAPPPAPSARVREAAKQGPAALEDLARDFPQDQEIQRELVRIHTAEGRGPHAMRALTRLVTLDQKWTRDPEMNEALHAALDGPFEASAAAIRVAENHFGERGVDILIDCAAMSGPAQQRCSESLAKPSVRAHASEAAALVLDLREAKTCDAKRSAIERAARDGDGRSLALLRPLTKRTGCGKRGHFDCWPCLRKDGLLEDAIAAIEQRVAKASPSVPTQP